MTTTFGEFHKNYDNLTEEDLLKILHEYDPSFFLGWESYNERYNSEYDTKDQVISLPAYEFDNIGELCRNFKK